jgi:hypothetical protein
MVSAGSQLLGSLCRSEEASSGAVFTVPLDGTNGTPNLTFHCSVVSAAVYAHGVPFLG